MKKTLLILTISIFAVACDSKKVPKSQDSEGNCKQSFVEAYNKVAGSNFEISSQDTKAKQELADSCKAIYKTFGSDSEDCIATDLSSRKAQYLSTRDLGDVCAKTSATAKFYGSESTAQ
jgi:hypothetical protein